LKHIAIIIFYLIEEVYHIAMLERVLIEDTNNSSQGGERNFLDHNMSGFNVRIQNIHIFFTVETEYKSLGTEPACKTES